MAPEGRTVPPPLLPRLHPFPKFVELLLLRRRKVFLHFRGGLIDNDLHLTPVLRMKFVEFLCGTARDFLDFLPLLSREIEFAGEASNEQVSDGGPLLGKDAGDLVPHIHPGADAANQNPGNKKNQEPDPYLPFRHDDHLFPLPRQSQCLGREHPGWIFCEHGKEILFHPGGRCEQVGQKGHGYESGCRGKGEEHPLEYQSRRRRRTCFMRFDPDASDVAHHAFAPFKGKVRGVLFSVGLREGLLDSVDLFRLLLHPSAPYMPGIASERVFRSFLRAL